MAPASVIRFNLFAILSITDAARVFTSVHEEFSNSLHTEDKGNMTAPVCGGNSEPKDYFFDLPGGTVDDSAAVRLIRNPSDPWLEVSRGAVWNVRGDVDAAGRVIPSSINFEARDKMDQHKRAQQYNLKSDMLYMKKKIENGAMWVEVKLKGCGDGPIRPDRPIGPIRPTGPTPTLDDVNTETLIDDNSMRPITRLGGKGRGRGRGKGKEGGNRNSRGDSKGKGKGKGSRKGNGKKGRGRRSHGSLLEEDSTLIDEAIVGLSEDDEENSASSDDEVGVDSRDAVAFVEPSEDDAEDVKQLTQNDIMINDDTFALLDLSEGAEDEGRTHMAKGKAKGKGRGRGRGRGSSRGARSIRPTKGDKGSPVRPGKMGPQPMRPSRPMGQGDCKPLTFAHGTFYPKEAVKGALEKETARGKAGGWILPSQTAKNVSMAPSLGKGVFGVLGFATLGALAVLPVVWVGQEGGLAAGPIGALVGGVASGGVAAYRSWKSQPKTASEKLYEKMYCMTTVKTCNGEACFKQCHDEDGNEAIVPTHSDPPEGIRC